MKIGILGAGQLARMLALSGHPLGMEFVFLCPVGTPSAGGLGEHIEADFDNQQALMQLASSVDVLTYEFENVPADAIKSLAAKVPLYPPVKALETARDRLLEKQLFNRLDIRTAEYATVDSLEDLQRAVANLGLPAILKTRTLGYDGKGQFYIKSKSQLEDAWRVIGEVPAILEAVVPFERELSIISCRSRSGEIRFYPLTENVHRDGILHRSTPRDNEPLQFLAESYAKTILQELDYVGTLAIELFQYQDHLLVNEMAPRVHNSGHWTIEGSPCSQFENHLRAILDLPLGSTRLLEPTVMLNLIGNLANTREVLSVDGAHLHHYRKSERPGRKVGHITITAATEAELKQQLARLDPDGE